MPRQSAKRSKKKRDDISDSETSDDEVIHFFVPGERINVEALAFFLFNFVDKTPKIRPSQHPNDKSRTGFNVTARSGLSVTNLRDIMNDTKDWDTEMNARSFKQQPCRYHESATAKRRLRSGPSKSPEETETSTQQAQIKSASPPTSNAVQAGTYSHMTPQQQQQQQLQQHYQQQQQQPSDYSRTGTGYYSAASKPEQPASTYNIHYTSVNTQYTSNPPGASHLTGSTGGYVKDYPSNYQPTGYPQQISKLPQDPPPYDQSNPRTQFDQLSPRVPPRNPQPGQPDPDAFDPDVKPPRSTNVEMAGSRQGSTAPPEDQSNRYGSPNTNRGEAYGRSDSAYNGASQRQPQYDASRRSGHRS